MPRFSPQENARLAARLRGTKATMDATNGPRAVARPGRQPKPRLSVGRVASAADIGHFEAMLAARTAEALARWQQRQQGAAAADSRGADSRAGGSNGGGQRSGGRGASGSGGRGSRQSALAVAQPEWNDRI
jgi:uncharacterized membrane protein YgcG